MKIKIFFSFLLLILLPGIARAEEIAAPPRLQLQVPILGYTTANNIAEYIAKIYEASLYIIIPFIILVIMLSGVLWILSRGDKSLIQKAKSRMLYGFIGLGIALFSYVLLNAVGINSISNLQIKKIDEIPSEDLDFPVVAAAFVGLDSMSAPVTCNNPGATPGGIYCPKSGGAGAMEQILKSTMCKVTYRFGGKGGGPPYTADTFTCDNGPCRNYCPSGTRCMDCSGYVNFALKCAGMPAPGGGTASIFGCNCSASEKIETYTNTSINGRELVIGDAIGYPTGCGFGTGHVYIYAGNGTLYESHGGSSGRKPGNSIRATQMASHKWLKSENGKHYSCIRRINR